MIPIGKITLLILLYFGISNIFAQSEKSSTFLGLNPGITAEPYYDEGEFDINILPIVFQRSLGKRIDYRLISILNYGIREGDNQFSHFGIEMGLPVFLEKKENKGNPSKGFYAAPIISLTRNNEVKHTNIGVWLEPGFHLLFKDHFAISFGLQLGGTYFNYDNNTDEWGDHIGFKVIIGKWI